jgi:hypothetical protein
MEETIEETMDEAIDQPRFRKGRGLTVDAWQA